MTVLTHTPDQCYVLPMAASTLHIEEPTPFTIKRDEDWLRMFALREARRMVAMADNLLLTMWPKNSDVADIADIDIARVLKSIDSEIKHQRSWNQMPVLD